VKEKDVREGVRKKRRVRIVNPVQPTSEHVSSPTPLNHVVPLTTIAGEAHVIPPMSAGRMCVLRDQTDEPVTPPVVNVGEFPTGQEDGQDGADAMFANEGHGDNEGGLSGLQTQPSPTDRLLEDVVKPASDRYVQTTEASMLCQSAQHQANVLLRFESLMEEHADLVYSHESCNDVKIRYKECKRELAKAQSTYDEKMVEELEKEKREAEQLTSEQAD
ncbi:hypothetical protein Tco_1297009, partial [Tanacetum coccineum]